MKTKLIIYGTVLLLFGLLFLLLPFTGPDVAVAMGQRGRTVEATEKKQPNVPKEPNIKAAQKKQDAGTTQKKDIQVTAPVASALKIDIWLDRTNGVYQPGQTVKVSCQAKRDCYFSLFRFNPDQSVDRIFPNLEKTFNFLEAGRVYTLKLNAGRQLGVFLLKAVVTIDPSNAVQEGVKFKSGALSTGPLRVIPLAQSVLFADWELMRFFHLPQDRYGQESLKYTVKP